MGKKTDGKKNNKIKQFFSKLVDKVDKKMEEKAKSQKCCCGDDSGKDSCCNR
jgi:hypothetical protein